MQLGPVCIETASRQAWRRIVEKLAACHDVTSMGKATLLREFIETTDFPRMRSEPPQSLRAAVRDALLVFAACAAVGAATNALRPGGIAFVQRSEYEILVPCPEGSGDAQSIAADDPAVWETRTLLVDARSTVEHQRWHPTGAIAVPFDYLEPTSPEQVRRIASSGAGRVVVFGDGSNPDSGEQLAREIAGKGIRNVRFVEGGAPLLEKAAAVRGVR